MNYEEARQIAEDGPSPGKWNWTNYNNSISDRPYTVTPCAWPDWQASPFDPVVGFPKVKPTGRPRCDHDTREEAERHYYDWMLSRLTYETIDMDTVNQMERCEVPECREWGSVHAHRLGGFGWVSLCAAHGNEDGFRLACPFKPGHSTIHS